MQVRMTLNKYEKSVIEKRAKEQGVKKWALLKEMSDFANEEVFKRFFEKDYKLKEEENGRNPMGEQPRKDNER